MSPQRSLAMEPVQETAPGEGAQASEATAARRAES
jgi:hypothetical protein